MPSRLADARVKGVRTPRRALFKLACRLPWLTAVVLALISILATDLSHAQDHSYALPPADVCVVQMILPEGATVTIGGKDYDQQRVFTYRSLDPDVHYSSSEVTIHFPDGTEHEDSFPVQAGRRFILIVPPPPKASAVELVVQTGHSYVVTSAAISPDGRYLLTGSHRTGVLWDIASGLQLRTFENPLSAASGDAHHFGGSMSVAFSPDGRRVLTSAAYDHASLWDLVSGRRLRKYPAAGMKESAIAFSPDGQLVATANEQTAQLYDASTGELLRTIEVSENWVYSLAFSPDSRRLLSGSYGDSDVQPNAALWDVANGKVVTTFDGHTSNVWSVAFSPNGKQVATGSNDGTAGLWDVATGRRVHTFQERRWGGVHQVSFSPNGRQLAIVSSDAETYRSGAGIWDVASGRKLKALSTGLVEFVPNGRQFVTDFDDQVKAAALWDLTTGNRLRTFQGRTSSILCVAFSPKGQQVVTGYANGTVAFWDAVAGVRRRWSIGDKGSLQAVAISPDAQHVVTGLSDNTASLWDASTGQRLRVFAGNSAPEEDAYERGVLAVAFSPDGRRLAMGGADATAAIWDIATARRLHTLEGHKYAVSCVAFSSDGRYVVTGSHDRSAALWDADSGLQIRTFKEHEHHVNCVAFSPDGRHVLTGSYDNTAIIWDTATGQRLYSLHGHIGKVISVGFSADGRHALTGGGEDKTIAVWDVATGRRLRTAVVSRSIFTCMAFHPEGRQVLTGSRDLAHLWDTATGDELCRLITLDAGDWLVTTPEGLFDGSVGGREKVVFRIGGGLNVVPVDRFFRDFYRRGLLSSILRGERPLPPASLGSRTPPKLTIVSPEPGNVDTQEVIIQVQAEDRGGGIGELALYQNGARILAPGESRRERTMLHRSFSVPLIEGRNTFKVVATGEGAGSWEQTAELVLTYTRRLPRTELYLVAVGINTYAEPSINLRFAADDARDIARVFQERGPALYGSGNVHATVLLDQQATKDGIRSALERTAQQAKGQDTLMLFLAGHGRMVGQRYYFIPHEFTRRRGTVADFEEDIRQQGLPRDELEEWIARIPAQKRVIIYDTCQSGAAFGSLAGTRSGFEFEQDLEEMSRSLGSWIIAAAAANESAQEISQLQHGALTYTLLAGIKAVSDEGPLVRRPIQVADGGLVRVGDWLTFAQREVPALTRYYTGQEQFVTVTSVADETGNFPLLPLNE